MANPHKGEVDYYFDDKHYIFKFSNQGHCVTEEWLGLDGPVILGRLGSPGPRILTGLLLGATRKYHAREFPNISFCHNFMDEVREAGAEEFDDLRTSLAAAYLGIGKQELIRRMSPPSPEDNPDPEESPKEETELETETETEEVTPKTPKKKASGRRSEVGASS